MFRLKVDQTALPLQRNKSKKDLVRAAPQIKDENGIYKIIHQSISRPISTEQEMEMTVKNRHLDGTQNKRRQIHASQTSESPICKLVKQVKIQTQE